MYKIAYYSASKSNLVVLSNAFLKFTNEKINDFEIVAKSKQELMDKNEFDEFLNYAKNAHILIIHLMGGKESCPGFNKLIKALPSTSKVYIQPCSNPIEIDISIKNSNVDEETWKKLYRYFSYGGVENFYNMLILLNNLLSNSNYPLAEPKPLSWEGIYHPEFSKSLTLHEYLNKKYKKNVPTIGIWFHREHWINNDLDYIDNTIKEIENRGANAIAVFRKSRKNEATGNLSAKEVIEKFFIKDEKVIIDSLINMMMFSATMMEKENKYIFNRLNVPIIKGILSFNTKENWEKSFQGLTPVDVSTSVALPEFDGNLITVPVAFSDLAFIDPLTGAKVIKYVCAKERISQLVSLTLNWVRLKNAPNREKKVAIIFHNYPPRNDNIGTAFGLDSPASVLNILKEMKKIGYKIDEIPSNGQELMEQMLSKATNSRKFTSVEQLYKKAVSKISLKDYKKWFEKLSYKVKNEMIKYWGEIPGDMLNYNDELIVPGIINGNIFIGIQPPRGFLEDSYTDIHNPDLPIPHHYYAYYEWIRNVFKADAIMHIGMHGSLEWLPGKSVGLSKNCYPQIAIKDVPNIYPYIINNPAEGTQAKRRSNCCIIDHMVPVMCNADTYEEMAELENNLEEYYEAKTSNPNKLPYLKEIIWEKFKEANLHVDLNIHEMPLDFDKFLEDLHSYLSEIKDTQIRDGLHTFGEAPIGDTLVEFLVALTRLENGDTPSLRKSIAKARGYDLTYLLDNRGKLNKDGKTNARIIDEIHNLSLQIISNFADANFNSNESGIEKICENLLGKQDKDVKKVLLFIRDTLVPKMMKTEDEIINSIRALQGEFVPPGPSGAPTRGMAHILPTGRNFYSVSPRTIPTLSAYKVGEKLANDLLERYLIEENSYPENVGIVIFGNGTMRTKGDDIGEILHLMGIRPVWKKENAFVKGLEVIPLEELKRPRIDVTLRISGFFRDAFPNIINLVDKAVQMVAFLDEPDDKNYIAKHVREEIASAIAKGKEIKVAKEEACYRIFGSKPGTYGAGVNNLINTKKWKNFKDLGDVFTSWGCYVYGEKNYGKTSPEIFKKRLSNLDVAVKNIDNRERGMMDSDDFYSFHGGMIAAVKTHKGKESKAFIGDSSEIERVKTRTVSEEMRHEFRARILNPKWIESMKKHGYKGAGDISLTVDYAFGWDATAKAMDEWMYEDLAKKFVLDKNFTKWMKSVNPWALQNITERLLESIQRNMWNADKEMEQKIKKVYLRVEGDIEAYEDK
ncbi:cobaltochelatase subunit CobN [Clostridium cochlearium]|uniref:cobaltochelatase subunit CobN n=1 Tax=Clostridium cochlearium TaxID=1494 RepID=UPI0024203575|nr:cobaltochelatase subunit CobN [Clostridium cochlearium]